VESQGLPRFLVLHEAGDDRINRAPGLVASERRRGAQHGGEIEERDGAEFLIAFDIDPGGIVEKAAVSGDIGGFERLNLSVE